jgi:hypothetical protein
VWQSLADPFLEPPAKLIQPVSEAHDADAEIVHPWVDDIQSELQPAAMRSARPFRRIAATCSDVEGPGVDVRILTNALAKRDLESEAPRHPL